MDFVDVNARIGCIDGWMDGWMDVIDRLLVGKPQHRVKVVYLAGVPFGSMKS
jgi:hypothetical protein